MVAVTVIVVAVVMETAIVIVEGRRSDRTDRDRRDDKFKRDNNRRDNKKSHQRTSSEKKTGFVIRNKGER